MSRQQVPNFQIVNNGVSLISAPDRVAGPLAFTTGGVERMRLDGNLYLNNWLMLTHSPSGGTYPAFGASGDDKTAIYGGPGGLRFSGNTGQQLAVFSGNAFYLDSYVENFIFSGPAAAVGNSYIKFGGGGSLANAQNSALRFYRGYDNVELASLNGMGHLTLQPAGARIKADMSSVPESNRLVFQNIITGPSIVSVMPSSGATGGYWLGYGSPDPTNSGYAYFGHDGTNAAIVSNAAGSAVAGNIYFSIGGSIKANIETNGDITMSTAASMLRRWGTNTGFKPMNYVNLGVNNAAPLFTNYEQGLVLINVPGMAAFAMFYIRGGAAAVHLIYNAVGAPNYQFTNTKNTLDSHNFYFDAGSYMLQNKSNAVTSYSVIYFKME